MSRAGTQQSVIQCIYRAPAARLIWIALLSGLVRAAAQTPVPVTSLDLNRFTTTWYQVERYPIKAQRHCVSDQVILYALGDKAHSFQIVTSCLLKDGNPDSWNSKGKLATDGSGRLKVNRLWPFTSQYWVLAAGPDYNWILVGNPNHKSLWILSKTKTLAPDLLKTIETQAAAQGYNTANLLKNLQPN